MDEQRMLQTISTLIKSNNLAVENITRLDTRVNELASEVRRLHNLTKPYEVKKCKCGGVILPDPPPKRTAGS